MNEFWLSFWKGEGTYLGTALVLELVWFDGIIRLSLQTAFYHG